MGTNQVRSAPRDTVHHRSGVEGVSLAATPEALPIHEIRSTRWIPEGGNGVSGKRVARLTTTPLYRIVTNDDNIPEKAL